MPSPDRAGVWLVEPGIGETRAVRLVDGEIVEALIERDGITPVGSRRAARLTMAAPRNALAVADDGVAYLLPQGSGRRAEGDAVILLVTREPIVGEGWKRPLARLDEGPADTTLRALDDRLGARALAPGDPADPLGAAGWDDLIDQARSGRVGFDGGDLRLFATPAMTLIDVDGTLAPVPLAMAAARAAGAAIGRLNLGGSIGIDFPTLPAKADRIAVAERLDEAIDDAGAGPVERTAINGFGLVQLIRPRRRASLIELAQDRPAFEARALLRRAARHIGAVRLSAHPAVIAAIEPAWIDALARQIGGAVELRADPARPMAGGDVA